MRNDVKYIFRKTDTVGAADAEEDTRFLRDCFVDTGGVDTLRKCSNSQRIVVGRTGAGKTALLDRFCAWTDRIIKVEPESLSISYIANSNILSFVSSLGVKLDIFFKLLWRHVLTVELIKYRFNIKTDEDKKSFFYDLRKMFYGKQHTKAIEYLNKWGQKFWEETEYRIKEVTNTLEKGITGAIQSQVPIASICAGAKLNLTEKQKSEVINRAQKVVNTVQIRQLSDILELINDVLSDEQKPHYIVIDGLDENWVDENLRYKLIRALIETVKDFRKVQNAKIIVAIRLDLLERVFKFTRDAGFQEEKYESLYYNVRWDEEQLEHILNLRINSLIKEKYTKRFVDIKDLLPRKIENNNPLHYMIERTMMRPRDIILFFNQCIQEANNKPIITSQMIKTAEGEYSRLRLRSLADEWRSDYPNLEEYVDVLKNRSKTFSLLEITEKEISDFCLNLAVKKVNEKDGLFFNAREVAEGSLDPNAFKAKLFLVFYNLGLIGLKLGPYEKANWITSGRRNVSLVEISDDIRAVIHPMFWRVLGIKIK